MPSLDSVPTGNAYTAACTLSQAYNGAGGFVNVAAADAYCELQYGGLGFDEWTVEFPLPQGTAVVPRGCTGIRFRSRVAGTPATISAAILTGPQPFLEIGPGGIY
jgi:hypothetical protein